MQTDTKSIIAAEIINEFKSIVGEDYVLYDGETLINMHMMKLRIYIIYQML